MPANSIIGNKERDEYLQKAEIVRSCFESFCGITTRTFEKFPDDIDLGSSVIDLEKTSSNV